MFISGRTRRNCEHNQRPNVRSLSLSMAFCCTQVPFGPQELRLNCSGACVDPECSNQPGASGPWWVPLAYTTAASNGTGATPARWLEMDSCNTGARFQHVSQPAEFLCRVMAVAVYRKYLHFGLPGPSSLFSYREAHSKIFIVTSKRLLSSAQRMSWRTHQSGRNLFESMLMLYLHVSCAHHHL